MPIYLHVRSVAFRFSPANYLRVCLRVLTASRAVITHILSIRSDRSTTEHRVTIPVTDHQTIFTAVRSRQQTLNLAAPNADWINPSIADSDVERFLTMPQSVVWTISTSLALPETSDGTDPSSRPATLLSPTLPTTSRSAWTSSARCTSALMGAPTIGFSSTFLAPCAPAPWRPAGSRRRGRRQPSG